MIHFRVLHVFGIIASVCGRNTDTRITFGYSTETNIDFYKDEPLVFSCKTDPRPLTRVITEYGITFSDDGQNPDHGRTGCQFSINSHARNAVFGTGRILAAPDDVTILNRPDKNACEAVSKESQWNLQLAVRIESALTKYNISCTYWNGRDKPSVSQEALQIEVIKVAPSDLRMIIRPAAVEEGDEINVQCRSTGADPQSEYSYIITKLGSGEEVTTDNTHKTTSADRGGLKVRCVDNQHPNYNNKSETEAERIIIPAYIDYIGQASKGEQIDLDSGKDDNILNCSEKIEGQPDLEYGWKRNGLDIQSTGPSYSVGNDGKEHNQTEVYECTAKVVNFNLSGTYKWQITWRGGKDDADSSVTWRDGKDDADSSVTWRDGKEDAGSSVGTIVGVLVGVAVCAAISIGGYVWWKNREKKKVRVHPVKREAGWEAKARVKAGQQGPVEKEAGVAGARRKKKSSIHPSDGKQ